MIYIGILLILFGIFVFLIGFLGGNPNNKFFNFFYDLYWSISFGLYSDENKDLVKHDSKIKGLVLIVIGVVVIFLSMKI